MRATRLRSVALLLAPAIDLARSELRAADARLGRASILSFDLSSIYRCASCVPSDHANRPIGSRGFGSLVPLDHAVVPIGSRGPTPDYGKQDDGSRANGCARPVQSRAPANSARSLTRDDFGLRSLSHCITQSALDLPVQSRARSSSAAEHRWKSSRVAALDPSTLPI